MYWNQLRIALLMCNQPPSKVNIYDMFRALVARVPWSNEAEKQQYDELIKELEEINLFGYMSQKTTVDRRK